MYTFRYWYIMVWYYLIIIIIWYIVRVSAQERVYRVCFHYHGRRRHRHPPCPASTDVLRARVRMFRIVVVGHDDPRGRHVHSSRRRGRPPYYFIVILYIIRDHPNFFSPYIWKFSFLPFPLRNIYHRRFRHTA